MYLLDDAKRGICKPLADTLRQENIGPVNKSSARFAKYLSNHLVYREVIYLIGKP